jgi:hypothetical protein
VGEESMDGRVKVKNKTNIKNKNLPFSIYKKMCPIHFMSNFQKTVRIMENPTLPTNWLAAAKHLMVSLGGMARAAISLR